MKAIRILVLSFVLALPLCGMAQDGMTLMKIEPGARPSGMGGAFVSIAGDPGGSPYNPATVAGIDRFAATFSHTSYWENVRMENGFFVVPVRPKWVLHGGVRYATIGDLEARQSPTSVPDALFDANDVSFKAGVAYQISPKISAGIAAGWYLEKIEAWRGSSFNVDLGIHARPMEHLQVGASATSLGSDMTLSKAGGGDSRPIGLPTTYRFGGAYMYRMATGALDVVIVDDEAHAHFGAEARVHEMFQVRGGWMFGYESKDLTAGATFTRRNLSVDYAFVPFDNDLGNSHVFSFTFKL